MPSDDPVRRLRDILRAIARIEAYVDDIGGIDALMRDAFLHRDAVERQLLILSEAAAELRGQVDEVEPSIDWNAIRGIGNFIRHHYDRLENEIIRRVLADELRPLAVGCERLIRHFEDQSDS